MLIPPVLRMPDITMDFTVKCNALGTGVGAVLLQEGHPITFSRQNLKGKALNLSNYEKMLAILLAVKKWRQYLIRRCFIIRTNQQSLKYLLDRRFHEESQYPWLQKLTVFNYIVEYKKGKENVVANALS